MKKYLPTKRVGALAVALAVALTTAAAIGTGIASAFDMSHWTDHYAVGYKLETYWRTSDGRDIIKAKCHPWWNAGGGIHYSYGQAYGSAWKCEEFDTIGRRFWVHLRVNYYGGLNNMIQYSCNDSNSIYYCP